MSGLPNRLRRWVGYRRMPWEYVRSRVLSWGHDATFEGVERFAMFLGYPRSGHSLVGALLSAHPDMVIAHELDALRYVQFGFSRRQLFWMLLQRDRWFSDQGQEWTGYQYAVPDQWQGRHRTLRVLGDKKGGSSSERLTRHPELLDRIERLVEVPVHYLHITRNPFDNITTMARKQQDSLASQADRYFELADAILAAQRRTPAERWFEHRQEEVVVDPKGSLRAMCGFLGVEVPDDYLESAASIVFDSPKKRRFAGDWSSALIEDVGARFARYPFLAGYGWDD